MGALFLCLENSKSNVSAVEKHFDKKGLKPSYAGSAGIYHVLLRKKKLIDNSNYYNCDKTTVFVTGSLFYKGLGYRGSLQKLVDDFTTGSVDTSHLRGNYFLIIHDFISDKLTIFIDPSGIKNVWFDPDRKIISTDYLAILASFPNNYSVNKSAVVENLITGALIPPDSYAKGIYRIDNKNLKLIEKDFPEIHIADTLQPAVSSINSFNAAVKHANERLGEYFEEAGNISEEYGANIGITGGFDSRLLLMHALKNFKNLSGHTFWRPGTRDYINALLIAERAGLSIYTLNNKPFIKPTFKEMMDTSFLMFDGQVRSQNYWDEEFSHPEYIETMAGSHLTGFHGFGGEQYRNADRFGRKISLTYFVISEWMFRHCRDPFLDKNLKEETFTNIRDKIIRLTGITAETRIDLEFFKKIQNEVWNISNRNTRLNALNQLHFCFAPFAEHQISRSAYSYIPFLGNSFDFEMAMLNLFKSELNKVRLNYGFSIQEGQPFFHGMASNVMAYIPRKLLHSIYYFIKPKQAETIISPTFFMECHPFLKNISGLINLNVIGGSKTLGKNILAMDTMLKNTNLNFVDN